MAAAKGVSMKNVLRFAGLAVAVLLIYSGSALAQELGACCGTDREGTARCNDDVMWESRCASVTRGTGTWVAGGTCDDSDLDGFVSCTGDCDDGNPLIFPGAIEICGDGIDSDCDGEDILCGPVVGCPCSGQTVWEDALTLVDAGPCNSCSGGGLFDPGFRVLGCGAFPMGGDWSVRVGFRAGRPPGTQWTCGAAITGRRIDDVVEFITEDEARLCYLIISSQAALFGIPCFDEPF